MFLKRKVLGVVILLLEQLFSALLAQKCYEKFGGRIVVHVYVKVHPHGLVILGKNLQSKYLVCQFWRSILKTHKTLHETPTYASIKYIETDILRVSYSVSS